MTPPTPRPGWYKKRRYHHGDLLASALHRGKEIVRLHGPAGLTMRGLARDLGVTATALAHLFRTVAGLREEVAAFVIADLETAAGVTPPVSLAQEGGYLAEKTRDFAPKGGYIGPRLHDAASGWIAFAAENANLYRLASGEGWHAAGVGRNGVYGQRATPAARRHLEDLVRFNTRCHELPFGDEVRARYVAATVHGLAMAAVEGVPQRDLARALRRVMAAPA